METPAQPVRVLELSRRGLTAVPDAVFDHADTLEVLDLAGNSLTTLPASLSRLTRLRAVFVSNNPMVRLPPVLGACPVLTQIGARGCGLRDLPAASLPSGLRWLTLTDNQLDTLPDELGRRPALQKLMLAGNRLSTLPDTLAGAANLELLRLSANRFERLPPWLAGLPRLAWLAFAGNPFEEPRPAAPPRAVPWDELRPGALLGEGASGRTYGAAWQRPGGSTTVAVKLFKDAMTSDGLPEHEMAACLAAGPHPNLIAGLGMVTGHPEATPGLLMPLIPAHWRVLAGPPSRASCSRDIYDPALRLARDVALAIARAIGSAAAHLHDCRLLHGDLYAHNTLWDGAAGAAVLTDFGAASFLPAADADVFASLDVLAWGILLGELLDLCRDEPPSVPRALQAACCHPDPTARPTLREALDSLAA